MTQLLQMYLGTLRLQLHNADRVDLISALAYVVSQLPPAQILPAMQAIVQPRVTRLREVLGQSGGAPEVANLLEELCALLRGVSPTSSPGTDAPQLQSFEVSDPDDADYVFSRDDVLTVTLWLKEPSAESRYEPPRSTRWPDDLDR